MPWGIIDSHLIWNNIWISECKIGSKFIMCDSTYWFTIPPPGVRWLSLQNVFNTHWFSLCKRIYAIGISLQNMKVKWNPPGGDGKPISEGHNTMKEGDERKSFTQWEMYLNSSLWSKTRGIWEEIIQSLDNNPAAQFNIKFSRECD